MESKKHPRWDLLLRTFVRQDWGAGTCLLVQAIHFVCERALILLSRRVIQKGGSYAPSLQAESVKWLSGEMWLRVDSCKKNVDPAVLPPCISCYFCLLPVPSVQVPKCCAPTNLPKWKSLSHKLKLTCWNLQFFLFPDPHDACCSISRLLFSDPPTLGRGTEGSPYLLGILLKNPLTSALTLCQLCWHSSPDNHHGNMDHVTSQV